MVAGLQSRLVPEFPTQRQHARSLASKHLATPAVEHKLSPGRILLAVPVSQNDDPETFFKPPPLSFLQTYDTSINRHMSRQALARNNVTNFTANPDGRKIKDANVTMMKLSCDGLWLATVEQWMPPGTDVGYLVHDLYSTKEERARRRETYLKFWSWNEGDSSWSLECRIDSPHQSESIPSENQTLDLASDPARLGFATVGEDCIVRVWRPKTRLRDGRVLRGARDGLTTWVCAQMIALGRAAAPDVTADPAAPRRDAPQRAAVAFSGDGSVLVASLDGGEDGASPGLVHFVDARTGVVQASQALMYTGALAGMLFLGRRLVVLSSRAVHVWDTVAWDLAFAFPLPRSDLPPPLVPALSHLAASATQGHFLISVPASGPAPKWPGATVFVFEAGRVEPCLRANLTAPVTAVVPLGPDAGGGFALIDVAGELRIVRPRGAVAVDPVRLAAVLEDAQAEAGVVDGPVDVAMGDADEASADEDMSDGESEGDAEDDGRPAVRANKLAKIFDGAPAFAMPPVQELFDSVARLYIGRKREGRSER
jgi:NET1-associated nuclear protein 1 (U3 small nucleolar RNA-associated protein 17)